MKRHARFAASGLMVVFLVVAVQSTFLQAASASAVIQHGIVLEKGCVSPTSIGSPYFCHYVVSQNVPGDTVTITGLSDVVIAASGDVNSGPMLGLLSLTLSGGATCNAAQTQCVLPDGGSIATALFSFYTVQPSDFTLLNGVLSDEVTATWTDSCTGAGASNCPVGTMTSETGSSTQVVKVPSITVTSVQQGGTTVTSVLADSTVTDAVTVSGAQGTPSGTASFTYFVNGACTGTGTVAGTPALNSGSATSSSEGPLTAGSYSFQASYDGNGTYLPSTGACEPFVVTSTPVTTTTLPTTTTLATTTTVPTTTSLAPVTAAKNVVKKSTPTTSPPAKPVPVVAGMSVHTGEPWAGTGPLAVAVAAGGALLLVLGELLRRRRHA